MNKIVEKEYFSEKVVKIVVEAPQISRSRKAGNFVILRVGEKGERFPLTIAGADPERGTITLVVQTVGVSSTKLAALEPGDHITDLVGPLGQATHVEKKEPSWPPAARGRRPHAPHRRSLQKSGQPRDLRDRRPKQGPDHP